MLAAPPPFPPALSATRALQKPRTRCPFKLARFERVGARSALMEFFSVCSCDDRKNKEGRQSKAPQLDVAVDSPPPAALPASDPLFDGLVLSRTPRPAELDRSFEHGHSEDRSSPVPRAEATLSRAAADTKQPSPLPSPSSRRSWRHAMAEVIGVPAHFNCN